MAATPEKKIRSSSAMLARWLICGCVLGQLTDVSPAADRTVRYLQQIKPLLRTRCYSCHGGLKQQAGLRLDTVGSMIQGGDSGAAITPGDPATSVLLQRVMAEDPDERMPPEHEGQRLSAKQVEIIRRWIADGAPTPEAERPEADASDHWAFRPVTRPALPASDSAGIGHPIDAFLDQLHRKNGLAPQPEAPRIVLLRRLYLDLIGVPPTAQELAAFESDRAPRWYERTVDRLLADPRYGERWARHWMDIWRYSDWWGLGSQLRRSQKHIWHWRDWIVESLNGEMPYDEMILLMLAADELFPNDLDKLRATGFLARNYWLFNRNQWMEETVEHVGKGVLGLTLNCSKCHDHKYDPIQQMDFYRMRAFFEPYHVRLDVVPGEPDLTRDGIPRVFDAVLDAPTYRLIRGQENQPDKSVVIDPGVPEFIAFDQLDIQAVTLPAEAWQPARRPWVIESHLAAAKAQVDAATAALVALRDGQPDRGKGLDRAEPGVSGAELRVAEARLSLAQAEYHSAQRRVEAMRISWTRLDQDPDADLDPAAASGGEEAVAAIRAERQVAVERARHTVAVAELNVRRAMNKEETKKKEQDETSKKLETARKSLNEALAAGRAEIKPKDRFTPYVGAAWTPTRFLFSGRDDPALKFVPTSSGRRTALARWITDPRNPLTARVAANHLWTRHMGRPLVATVFDFGRNGTPPTHPELLDWLAAELVDSGWSFKHLHRLIVTSAAYRMSSSAAGGAVCAVRDPDNRYWWRRSPIRLESQLIRDSILAHASRLDTVMGGPAVAVADQPESTRRSLYFFHSNNERNLFLKTFDEARVTECYRREQSIVPQQALALTNSRLVLDSASEIAGQLSEPRVSDSAFIRRAFAVLLGIEATEEEVAASRESLAAWQGMPEGSPEIARAHLVWALINHNDFVTLR